MTLGSRAGATQALGFLFTSFLGRRRVCFGSSCHKSNPPAAALSLPIKPAEDRQAAGGDLVLQALLHPGFMLKLMPVCR